MFPITYISIGDFDDYFAGNTYTDTQKEVFIFDSENKIDSFLIGRTYVESQTEKRIFPARIVKDGGFVIPDDVRLCSLYLIGRKIKQEDGGSGTIKSMNSGEQSITYFTSSERTSEEDDGLQVYLGGYLITSLSLGV